ARKVSHYLLKPALRRFRVLLFEVQRQSQHGIGLALPVFLCRCRSFSWRSRCILIDERFWKFLSFDGLLGDSSGGGFLVLRGWFTPFRVWLLLPWFVSFRGLI